MQIDFKRPIKCGGVWKFVAHSYRVLKIASRYGWMPAARYTNLRDVRRFDRVGFIDINWRNYSFDKHLAAVKATRPLMTVARDIESPKDFEKTLDQARELQLYAKHVVIVPKHQSLVDKMHSEIPEHFILGYSVPTRYGGTRIAPDKFRRPVHLLGGRPDVQRKIASVMPVVSVDCNRFTLDASFGDYFDGEIFRPHPVGGYELCLKASIRHINGLWRSYERGNGHHKG